MLFGNHSEWLHDGQWYRGCFVSLHNYFAMRFECQVSNSMDTNSLAPGRGGGCSIEFGASKMGSVLDLALRGRQCLIEKCKVKN